jgi:hypothetical protein
MRLCGARSSANWLLRKPQITPGAYGDVFARQRIAFIEQASLMHRYR